MGLESKERPRTGFSVGRRRGGGGNISSFPAPPPLSFSGLLPNFSRGQNTEDRGHSSVFLCSPALRKRLLYRLELRLTNALLVKFDAVYVQSLFEFAGR